MILVSAGHHAAKAGACFEDFCEFDEAARWAKLIVENLGDDKSLLVPFGVLKDKVNFINERSSNKNTIAVEIHFNSAVIWKDDNKDGVKQDEEFHHVGRGSETLYYPNSVKGKAAAEVVQNNLSRIFLPNRGVKEGWYRMQKRFGPDYFLAKTKCTSLIIEPEFIDNKETIIKHRKTGCLAIAESLLELTTQQE